MRFCLLDRIIALERGKQIKAVKQLRADEQYLQDHFPRFPVMPGVMMLESLFQASMWLVRHMQDFSHSAVLLQEARNVKYADFVEPGQTLEVEAVIQKQDDQSTTLKATGIVDGSVAVSGRLIVEHFDFVDRYPDQAAVDPYTKREMRKQFEQLCEPGVL